MSAKIVSLDSSHWEYCLRDATQGQGYVCWTAPKSVSTEKAQQIWWGFENENSSSQMGNTYADHNINLRWLQYQLSTTGSQWYVVTNNSTTPCNYIGPSNFYSWPYYWPCDVYSTVDVNGDGLLNDYETIEAQTTLH